MSLTVPPAFVNAAGESEMLFIQKIVDVRLEPNIPVRRRHERRLARFEPPSAPWSWNTV